MKIAIVGAGRVGSTLAYTLAISSHVREIVIIDLDQEHAEGEAMDIAHAVSFYAPVKIAAGELKDAAGAAVTVIAAGVAQKEGEGRPELLQRNLAILRNIIPELVAVNPEGIVLMATNPVDALTLAALRLSGLPPTRVFGSGTVLDTARLRASLAQHYGIDARNVHAYVLGEHGDSELVAWSAASIANLPLGDYCRLTGMACSLDEMNKIELTVRDAAYEIIRRKGATNFAIASTLTRIIEAIVRDEKSVLTVSTLLQGNYDLHDVCLSLPAIIGRSGMQRIIEPPLSSEELNRLHKSASAIHNMLSSAGIK